MSKQKNKIALFLPAGVLVIGVAIGTFFLTQHRQPVGAFDFSLPGASVLFLDNGKGAGNEKVYTVKGKDTAVSVDFNNILAYAGKANLDTVKTETEEWRKTQALVMDASKFKQLSYQPFEAGQIKGYYQLTEIKISRGRINQSRNLFFLKDGQPYQIIFSFVEPKSESDKTLVSQTWTTLLKQIGIPPSILPIKAP